MGRNPDYILVGAMKAGTTVFHKMIGQHPQVKPVQHKFGEVHFFDNPKKFQKGLKWYQGLFDNPAPVTGEKSPRYMADPWSMCLMKKLCPDVKLLVILRDPVFRFLSCKTFDRRRGHKFWADSFWRGCYTPQLQHIFNLWDRSQVNITFTEHLRNNTVEELQKVFHFLGVEPFEVERINRDRKSGQGPKWKELRQQLACQYRPMNEALVNLLPEYETEIHSWEGMDSEQDFKPVPWYRSANWEGRKAKE